MSVRVRVHVRVNRDAYHGMRASDKRRGLRGLASLSYERRHYRAKAGKDPPIRRDVIDPSAAACRILDAPVRWQLFLAICFSFPGR